MVRQLTALGPRARPTRGGDGRVGLPGVFDQRPSLGRVSMAGQALTATAGNAPSRRRLARTAGGCADAPGRLAPNFIRISCHLNPPGARLLANVLHRTRFRSASGPALTSRNRRRGRRLSPNVHHTEPTGPSETELAAGLRFLEGYRAHQLPVLAGQWNYRR